MSRVNDDQDRLKIDSAGESNRILIRHKHSLDEEDHDSHSCQEVRDDQDEDQDNLEFLFEDDQDHLDFLFEEEDMDDQRKNFLEVIKQQVLPRLPAKSLLRMKSTSRQWNRYISSPLFIHIHSTVDRSVTGFFFHTPSGAPSFASLDADPTPLPDPSLSFLPESVLVKSSAAGLLCCHGRTTRGYYVCNPMTAEWTALPSPLNDHGPDPAVAIAMREPSAYNFSADYYLSCAYEVCEGVYAFESFSSVEGTWRRSNEIVAAERIVAGSGVSAGGCVYWRTTMRTLLGYDPETDAWRMIFGPGEDEACEIGELGGRLCHVGVKGEAVEVMVLEDGSGDEWRKVTEFAMGAWEAEEEEDGYVVPLRTQGDREVVVWEGASRTVVVRDIVRGCESRLVGTAVPGYCTDFLPYVGSLVEVRRYMCA